jgi:hypothetical protein
MKTQKGLGVRGEAMRSKIVESFLLGGSILEVLKGKIRSIKGEELNFSSQQTHTHQ